MSDFVVACEECGRLIEDTALVHSTELPSSKNACSRLNIVSEDSDGTNILLSTSRKRKRAWKRGFAQSLEAQATCRAQELKLPRSVCKRISEIVSSNSQGVKYALSRAQPQTASAVLVYLAARLDRFPLTLRSVCAHCNVQFAPAVKMFSQVSSKMPGCSPPVPVRLLSFIVAFVVIAVP